MNIEFFKVPKDDLATFGKDAAEVMILAGFAKSKNEARRLIKQGAFRINDRLVSDPFARIMIKEKDHWCVIESE